MRDPSPGHTWHQGIVLLLPTALSLTAVGFGVAGIVLLAEERRYLGAALLAVGIAAGLARLLWIFRFVRVRSQSLSLCGGHVPQHENELLRVLEECLSTGSRPTVVGSGWGFWTAHVIARGNVIHMHAFTGERPRTGLVDPTPSGMMRFLSGTTIHDAEKAIRRKYNRTFWSTPSIQTISLGGWFGGSCHGNSGAGGKASSFSIHEIEFYEIYDGFGRLWPQPIERREPYKAARRLFDADLSRYVIVAVTFDVLGADDQGTSYMVDANTSVQKKLCTIPVGANVERGTRRAATPELTEWLDDGAPLRLLFCGSARRTYALGLKYTWWAPQNPRPYRWILGLFKSEHVDPHDCSAACMSLQLDAFSMICGGWYETADDAYNGRMLLVDANRFTPDASLIGRAFYGLGPAMVHLFNVYNCEFVFNLLNPLSSRTRVVDVIQQLVDELVVFCRSRWARCEIRTNTKQASAGVVFVDCGMSEANMCELVPLLAPFARERQLAMHTSKYQSSAIRSAIADAGLQLVLPSDIYYGLMQRPM